MSEVNGIVSAVASRTRINGNTSALTTSADVVATSGDVVADVGGKGGAKSSAIEKTGCDEALDELGVDDNLGVGRNGFHVIGRRFGGGGGGAGLGGHGAINTTERMVLPLVSKVELNV